MLCAGVHSDPIISVTGKTAFLFTFPYFSGMDNPDSNERDAPVEGCHPKDPPATELGDEG